MNPFLFVFLGVWTIFGVCIFGTILENGYDSWSKKQWTLAFITTGPMGWILGLGAGIFLLYRWLWKKLA